MPVPLPRPRAVALVLALVAGFLLLLMSGLVAFVSWKGASVREVLLSSRRSLIVGAVATAVDEINRRFGRIDILVNTVGGYRAGAPLHETPLSDWDFMLDLNARSVFVMCQTVIPHMLGRNHGRIVNVASRAALHGYAGHAAYSASKAAVVRLTESMDAELKDRGVNVNCVMPAIIDTPQNRSAMPDADFGRWVAPEAVADVILFLASEGARAIHGAAIPVYGRS